MVSTALGLAAASWAVLMALSPMLQIREIVRAQTERGKPTSSTGKTKVTKLARRQ